jgi:hypothetical protein
LWKSDQTKTDPWGLWNGLEGPWSGCNPGAFGQNGGDASNGGDWGSSSWSGAADGSGVAASNSNAGTSAGGAEALDFGANIKEQNWDGMQLLEIRKNL